MNLFQALEPLFTLPEKALLAEVRDASMRYGHQPPQIAEQLAELGTPLYRYVPHPTLVQRNMLVMDRLGVRLTRSAADQPGKRSWLVTEPTLPASPYAEQVISGYVDMTSPRYNNLTDYRFFHQPPPTDTPAYRYGWMNYQLGECHPCRGCRDCRECRFFSRTYFLLY